MARGFYRLARTDFPAPDEDGREWAPSNATILDDDGIHVVYHAAVYPHPELHGLAEDLGATWAAVRSNLPQRARDRVFWARVTREEIVDGVPHEVTRHVSRANIRLGPPDDIVEVDWLPPHKFAGDAEPEPVT